MKTAPLLVAALALGATACKTNDSAQLTATGEAPCSQLEPAGDVGQWLASANDQKTLARIFECAQTSENEALPQGMGQGRGTLYSKWPLWNNLQTKVGSTIWGGKRFYTEGGKTRLLNLMKDSGTERYRAEVYVGASARDGKNAIILDYSKDDSRQMLGKAPSVSQIAVDGIIHRVRDEIREVRKNGQPTGVFIGRAHITFLSSPVFAANFFLDFRGNAPAAVATPAPDCNGKKVLVVTSSAGYITLAGGERYPTGYFLRELTDPLIPLLKAGCKVEFATPGGKSPVVDSNSLELLWSYYPYRSDKSDAARRRDDGIALAEAAYGKLRFSEESPQWTRISPEVQNYVKIIKDRQSNFAEIPPRSLTDVVSELAAHDAAGEPSPYGAILIPGGHVPMEDLKGDANLGKILNHFHAHDLPTALVCHAPVALLATTTVGPMTYAGYRATVADRTAEQMLEEMGPLQGYRLKSYVDDDLEAGGVTLTQNPWPGYPHVVADRELLTAQNPASAPFIGELLVESIRLAGTPQWWTARKVHVVDPAIQDEQAKITAKVKKLSSFSQRLFLGGPNIFLSTGYLQAFDAAATFAEKAAKLGNYGNPSAALYRLPIPGFGANYFPPRIDGFYSYDLSALIGNI